MKHTERCKLHCVEAKNGFCLLASRQKCRSAGLCGMFCQRGSKPVRFEPQFVSDDTACKLIDNVRWEPPSPPQDEPLALYLGRHRLFAQKVEVGLLTRPKLSKQLLTCARRKSRRWTISFLTLSETTSVSPTWRLEVGPGLSANLLRLHADLS